MLFVERHFISIQLKWITANIKLARDTKIFGWTTSRSNVARFVSPRDLSLTQLLCFCLPHLSVSLCLFTRLDHRCRCTRNPRALDLPVSGHHRTTLETAHPGRHNENSNPDRRCDQHDQHGDVNRFRANRHLHPRELRRRPGESASVDLGRGSRPFSSRATSDDLSGQGHELPSRPEGQDRRQSTESESGTLRQDSTPCSSKRYRSIEDHEVLWGAPWPWNNHLHVLDDIQPRWRSSHNHEIPLAWKFEHPAPSSHTRLHFHRFCCVRRHYFYYYFYYLLCRCVYYLFFAVLRWYHHYHRHFEHRKLLLRL